MNLQKKLEAMAEQLIDKATAIPDDGQPMDIKNQIDIFKATSTFHLGLRKRSKEDDEEATGGTFEDLRTRINGDGAKQ